MEEVAPVDQRFGKSRRLLRRAEFLAVQDGGKSARSRHFVVLVKPRETPDHPARLGVVTSRKVGNAVARNRGRRRVREWFRQHSSLPLGFDVVVILRSGAPDLSFADLTTELDGALPKALGASSTRRRRARR